MNNYDDFYPTESSYFLEAGLQNLELQLAGIEGKDVSVDGVDQRVVLQIYTNPLSKKEDNFKIMTRTTSDIERGSLIKYGEEYYLVLTKPQENDIYKYANIEFCNQTLTWIDDSGNLKSYPCVLKQSGESSDTIDSDMLPITDSLVNIFLQNNSDVISLKNDKRFMLDYEQTYKMVNHGSVENRNTMKVTLVQDMYNSETDKVVDISGTEYLIADYKGHNETIGYTMQFTPDEEGIVSGSLLEVRVDRLNNGAVEVDTFTFTVDGSSTASASDYEFNIVDGNNYTILNKAGNKKTVIIKVVDDGSLAPDELKEYTLNGYF